MDSHLCVNVFREVHGHAVEKGCIHEVLQLVSALGANAWLLFARTDDQVLDAMDAFDRRAKEVTCGWNRGQKSDRIIHHKRNHDVPD